MHAGSANVGFYRITKSAVEIVRVVDERRDVDAISVDTKVGLLRRITRQSTVSFGEDEWLDNAHVGRDVLALLPGRTSELSQAMIKELERVFGEGGEFEAFRV